MDEQKLETDSFERHIVKLRLDPKEPPIYLVTFDCGHEAWFVTWPANSHFPCAQCVNHIVYAAKAPRQIGKHPAKKKGGHARAKSLTPARRTEIAKKAADARWNKKE